MADVASVRELDPLATLRVATIAPGEVVAELQRQLAPEDLRSFETTTTLYRLLGHLRRDQDMKSVYFQLASSGAIGGFYSPAAKALWVVGDASGAVDFDTLSRGQKSTLAHEFVHALQDFNFDLTAVYRSVVEDLDRNLASIAAIEGDAVTHASIYSDRYLAVPMPGGGRVFLASVAAQTSDIPASILREFYFPYTAGADWVRGVRQRSGTARVNQLIANPPRGTAYVLHPELLDNGFQPATVTLPDLRGALGAGWERQSGGALGEFGLRNYLQLHIRALDAVTAAGGWAGDHYDAYTNGGRSVAAFRVRFSDATEAAQFAGAQTQFLQAAGATSEARGGWRLALLPDGDATATLAPIGADIVFVIGSDAEAAAKAIDALAGG